MIRVEKKLKSILENPSVHFYLRLKHNWRVTQRTAEMSWSVESVIYSAYWLYSVY